MFRDSFIDAFSNGNEIRSSVVDSFLISNYREERVKARKDKVSINGVSIDYDKLCNFKVYNEQGTYMFIPRLTRMNGKKLTEKCKEVDLTSVINIGIAESFFLLGDILTVGGSSIVKHVFGYLSQNYPILDSDISFLELAFADDGANMSEVSKLLPDNVCCEHPYYEEFMHRFKPENTIVMEGINALRMHLDALSFYNMQNYALALTDLLSFLMAFKEFLYDLGQVMHFSKDYDSYLESIKSISKCKGLLHSSENYYNRFSSKDHESVLDSCFDKTILMLSRLNFPLGELKFSPLRYTVDDNVGKITDARQFSIALVGVLGYNYLSCGNDYGINFLDLDYLYYKINSCLGDDLFARSVTGCISTIKEDGVFTCNYSGWRRNFSKYSISKYEDFVVWKKYNKSSLKYEDFVKGSEDTDLVGWSSNYYQQPLLEFVFYSTPASLNRNLLNSLDKNKETISKLTTELSDTKRLLKSKSKEVFVDTSAIEKRDIIIEDLKKQIEELERINASKSDIIANKTEEISSLNSEIAMFFGDDYEPEVIVKDVSQEEKVAFLNDFNFVFVNGLVGFDNTLQSIGIKNYRVVNTCGVSMSLSQSYKADFVIYCTNFISHAVCSSIKSVYDSQAECCYYTGTNIDKMVDFLYNYVNNYLAN